MRPGTSAYLNIKLTGNDPSCVELNNNNELFLFKARLCEMGELYRKDLTCRPCSKNTYTFIPMTQPDEDD